VMDGEEFPLRRLLHGRLKIQFVPKRVGWISFLFVMYQLYDS